MKMKIKILSTCILAVVLFILFSTITLATSSTTNITAEQQAADCLNSSHEYLTLLENQNFSTNRVNDTIKEAENLYSAQIILKQKLRSYDFSLISSYCEDIQKIFQGALSSRDEFAALIKFYNSTLSKEMNTSSVDIMIIQITDEIKNERYENVPPLIDKTYQEIIDTQSSQTTLNLFYQTTSRGLKVFFERNWKVISIIVAILLILFLIYRMQIIKWMLKRKIAKLELRKKTIKELIMRTQKDYFEKGKMSEVMYSVRTKKFAELMRDIERQIPLLQEELAKVEYKKDKMADKLGVRRKNKR